MKFKELPHDIRSMIGTICRSATMETKEYQAYCSALRDLVSLLRNEDGCFRYAVDTKQFKKDGKVLAEIYDRYSGSAADPKNQKKRQENLLNVLNGKLNELFGGKIISHPGQGNPFITPYVQRVDSVKYSIDTSKIEFTGMLFYKSRPGESGFDMSTEGRTLMQPNNMAIDSVSDASDFRKILKKQLGIDGKVLDITEWRIPTSG